MDKWSQAQRARNGRRLKQKPRKLRRPAVRKTEFLLALPGTGGIINRIAKRLDLDWITTARLLDRPDWGTVRDLWLAERQRAVDEAEDTILYSIRQRHDLPTASTTARWLLAKLRKDRFGDENKVVVEGGRKAVRMEHEHSVEFPLEKLPLKVKRKLLRLIEVEER